MIPSDSLLRLNYEALFSSFTAFKSPHKNRHLYPILHKWQLQQILFQQSPDENSECLSTPYIVILVVHGLVFHVTG